MDVFGKVMSLLFNMLSRWIYIIQKSCIYIHIVSLCLPMDFKPVFVAGTPARHRAAQSSIFRATMSQFTELMPKQDTPDSFLQGIQLAQHLQKM